ncbi:Dopey, N-terminal-domain-containing protein [Scheffersomyces xylosifermentans]|uniref:Dopey, N-terminal-domain-containing protein n=1 Tax=Scheffersomyces xylosifermentans TaxID=1304137 RepID=UPI00315DD087
MESSKLSNNLLKGIHSLGLRKTDQSQLTSKDKRYVQSMEKVLASFDALEEWADYIAFLSRLSKALQLSDDAKVLHTVSWIPYPSQVANKLSLCLSSRLPSGVHQKTLSIYESIFNALTPETLNKELPIWLPGLLPLLSYCSISVKPQFIRIFKEIILDTITQNNLRIVSKPLILSLLPGLDDENSEVFTDILDLMDNFKLKLNDDPHFWQSMFLCIISNPEKRLGALFWCNKRLPVFTSLKESDPSYFSDEARACLTPESGLLIRALSTSINSKTSLNSASDIIVVRGFFDILLSHLPLDSAAFEKIISSKDKELLIMSSCRVTLKKDMSLNRRLWNLFLGPESDPEHPKLLSRSEYFKKYALENLTDGLLRLVNSKIVKEIVEGFKLAQFILMDKWEISNLITPNLFSPFLSICYKNRDNIEILGAAQSFFDGIESSYIWNDIVNILVENNIENLDLLEFVLRTFNFNEEEMITVHAPLAILCLMANCNLSIEHLKILELMFSLVPSRAFSPIESESTEDYSNERIMNLIKVYYRERLADESAKLPFSVEHMSYLIIKSLKQLVVRYISDEKICYNLSTILCDVTYSIPQSDLFIWSNRDLIDAMLALDCTDETSNEATKQKNLLIAFGIAKIFNTLSKSLTELERKKILKIILSNLWPSIYSSYPANHQVESVKTIYELEISCSSHNVEAGILDLLLKVPRKQRVKAFETLWTHSVSFSEGDSILVRPLQLLLDDLCDDDNQNSLGVKDFIRLALKNGSGNRLLKLITNPLLDYDFMHSDREELRSDDDLAQFSYYMGSIVNVIQAQEKSLKEAFNNEFAVTDSNAKLSLIKSNNWDISTYKSLLFSVTDRFLKLALDKSILDDEDVLNHYYSCINNSLKLLNILVTGNESFFGDKFHLLINTCNYYMHLPNPKSHCLELIQTKFLASIFHFLEVSQGLKINLNLLHVTEEGKKPLLVRFIIEGIDMSKSSLLLESWISLLTRSLYLFNESVFSVLLTLNDALIKKIEYYFTRLTSFEPFGDSEDMELSTNILITGLEDLLSISHSFLVTSNLRASADKTNQGAVDSGFLNTVIQGVFQIESPAIRTSEQNKLYSILLSFQDSVKIAFRIWNWSDSKPKIPIDSTVVAERSLTYLGHKLKFRARKLLESLMDLEKQEVIETLVEASPSMASTIKLLNILDGGRSQVTLPFIFDSIYSRCYPQLLEETHKSSLNIPITEKDLSKFLVNYFESIDNDTISDVWGTTIHFLRDVATHPTKFHAIYPDCLKICRILSNKTSATKLRDQKKARKELSDTFVKVFNSTISKKSVALNQDSDKESDQEEVRAPSEEPPNVLQDDILEALNVVIPSLENIVDDSDRVSTLISTLISHLITPQIRPKRVDEISMKALALLEIIGRFNPSRAWKALVFDSFMDISFFSSNATRFKLWDSIIESWISNDKERFSEMITKITPSVSSSPSNLFIWNESSEVESKISTIKRITYLIIIQPNDYFLTHLDELFDRIEYSLNTECPANYRSEITTLLRAITLKFSELHLLPHWTIITQELTAILDPLCGKSTKELANLAGEHLKLILFGCKLLDQLLLLGYDEFNLNEWLFVSSSPDIITSGSKDNLLSLIDKIASENDLPYIRDSPIKIEQPHGELVPLLRGHNHITSITKLRSFFESFSLIHYERTFGLFDVDRGACLADIQNDLT